MANAFGELHDPDEQSRRMKIQQDAKDSGDLEAQPIDDSYIEALEFCMPSAGGIGFGVERLLMMFLNKDSIREMQLISGSFNATSASFSTRVSTNETDRK